MGWSIDIATAKIEGIYRKHKRRVEVSHPQSPHPTVEIRHEGEMIPLEAMREVVELFPESVYVQFVPEWTPSEVQ